MRMAAGTATSEDDLPEMADEGDERHGRTLVL